MACLGNSGRAIPRRRRNTRAAQPDQYLLPSWKLDAKGFLEIKVPTVQTNMIFPSVSGHGRTGLEQVPWVLKTAKLPLQLLPPHHQLLTHFSIHLTPGSPLIIMVQASTWIVALGCLLSSWSFFVSGSPLVPTERGVGLSTFIDGPIQWRGALEEGQEPVYLTGGTFEVYTYLGSFSSL
jgi:hypothetical protein